MVTRTMRIGALHGADFVLTACGGARRGAAPAAGDYPSDSRSVNPDSAHGAAREL